MILFNLYKSPLGVGIIMISILQKRKPGPESFSNVLQVTVPLSGIVKFSTRDGVFRAHTPVHCVYAVYRQFHLSPLPAAAFLPWCLGFFFPSSFTLSSLHAKLSFLSLGELHHIPQEEHRSIHLGPFPIQCPKNEFSELEHYPMLQANGRWCFSMSRLGAGKIPAW